MILHADYAEKILQTMDVANVYDCSAMVRTDAVIQSCAHLTVIKCFENSLFLHPFLASCTVLLAIGIILSSVCQSFCLSLHPCGMLCIVAER